MIALVTRISDEAEHLWLEALSLRMPEEKIVSFRHLNEEERAAVDIAIVANPDPMDLARLPGLTWIHSLWAGVERLVSEIGDSTLPVVRLVDPQLSRTMAEAVLAWTYYLFRDMPAYARFQRERSWQQLPYRRPEQVTVGLLGLGALGEAAAHRLIDAGFKVIGWSRSAKDIGGIETHSGDDGLNAVLRRSDILVCLLPQTSETRALLNAERLALLPANASLINFARGPIVVSEDLLQALDTGRLSHAVLDVFDVEPLPADAPFWDHPRITVLPHISAPTDRETAAALVADNIRTFRRTATLPSIVDFARGY
ncbi:glyoxylate/hydroxypyruvate reductase A [Rhizobium rhizogenes]|nr:MULTISPECIES: glyoxylate/hydroxypyruvate reductase A [Rhizobium]OCJ19059.1 glyoxylate/hydroxypyruvate reductase A [Agrobacterium sp. B131/95]EJK87965.1 phosphoglycerate dehydrogenase-like oxidoreductase [Rhizobium sp. AP16]MDJ1638311.1 glyoxylate/hydroxypyruvate reductase A [Rhizobium rhizogenes]NTG88444.1 glyoxylate/hydroxypyruvate reductase A [Rhizobium rhizogenes]NTH20639.1 glyoxylate/hydroxypyruvate reductase A [Rhizobium rhizogenes]